VKGKRRSNIQKTHGRGASRFLFFFFLFTLSFIFFTSFFFFFFGLATSCDQPLCWMPPQKELQDALAIR